MISMAGSALPSRMPTCSSRPWMYCSMTTCAPKRRALGQRSGDLAARVRDRHADGRAVGVGLDDTGQLRFVGDGVDLVRRVLQRAPFRGGDVGRDDALGQVLVHGDGAAEVARAGVGDAEQVERRLHPSVLAAGAVERDEHDVRHGADAQNVLAEDIFALVLPARADGVEIRLLTGDGEIAAQAVRRVKKMLSGAPS